MSLRQLELSHEWSQGELVHAVAWSPSGTTLAVGTKNGANLIDPFTNTVVQKLHDGNVVSLAWSPEGDMLAMGSGGETCVIRIILVSSGSLLRKFEWDVDIFLPGFAPSMPSVDWSPQGEYLAVGLPRKLCVVERSTGHSLWDLAHESSVACVAWSPAPCSSLPIVMMVERLPSSRKLLATGCHGKARIIDALTGRLLHSVQHGFRGFLHSVQHGFRVNTLAWRPDGQLLATGSDDLHTRVINPLYGEVLAMFKHEGRVLSIAWSPDGKQFVTGHCNGRVERLAVLVGRRSILRDWSSCPSPDVQVESVNWSPDGAFLVTGGFDGNVRILSPVRAVVITLTKVPCKGGDCLSCTSMSGEKLAQVEVGWEAWRIKDKVASVLGCSVSRIELVDEDGRVVTNGLMDHEEVKPPRCKAPRLHR